MNSFHGHNIGNCVEIFAGQLFKKELQSGDEFGRRELSTPTHLRQCRDSNGKIREDDFTPHDSGDVACMFGNHAEPSTADVPKLTLNEVCFMGANSWVGDLLRCNSVSRCVSRATAVFEFPRRLHCARVCRDL
jgi:hypothetical protein